MTILSMPEDMAFDAVTWALQTNTSTWESPFTRATQTKELAGARWVATYSMPAYKRADRAKAMAFLAKLRGAAGRFYAYNPSNMGLLGAGGGAPIVAGPDQTGSSLLTDGWPADTLVLKAGDEFQIGAELKQVVDDVLADENGIATINFEPPLRHRPADNTPIILDKPSCIMRLVDDNQNSFNEDVAGFATITFSAVEVF